MSRPGPTPTEIASDPATAAQKVAALALPKYAALLFAYHAAYAGELRQMLAALPIKPGDRALDVACGDGAYSGWLKEIVGATGSVTALDLDPAWLSVTKRNCAARRVEVNVVEANAEQLPFDDNGFDLVWCAQSLYSLPNTEAAIREMVRVARPGGVVAVLENDTLHHIMLPWPIDLELKVRQAELKAFQRESADAARYYIARGLTRRLHAYGLGHVVEQVWATSRQAPLAKQDRLFLSEYLHNLRERVEPFLAKAALKQLEVLALPASHNYLLDRPELSVACLDRLAWGVKPGMVERNAT